MIIFSFPKRVINHIRKSAFMKGFQSFDRSSAIGLTGIGDTCIVKGKENMVIGAECRIGYNSELITYNNHFSQNLHARLSIGNNVRITARCRITCAGNITIGNDVLIAPDVFITDHNHGNNPTIAGGYSPQPLQIADVTIGDGCWLGQRVCVLPGVTIGAHSIIGANSVVTHDVPAYCIAVGMPARVIKRWNFETEAWERA